MGYLAGVAKGPPGTSLDEFPFASSMEGERRIERFAHRQQRAEQAGRKNVVLLPEAQTRHRRCLRGEGHMIDEPRLYRALDEVVRHLGRLRRTATLQALQPSLTPQEVSQAEANLPFVLTEEVRALYRWRNGTRAETGDILSDLWFFPGYYLFSLDEAVQTFRERRLAPQWRKGWFPFFGNGAGDFYVVHCTRKAADAAPVIGFLHGEPEQDVEYLDVLRMIETLAECYAQGAFFVTPDGRLEMDDDTHRRIARQNNPGVDAWQD
jgi:hypothetical protein